MKRNFIINIISWILNYIFVPVLRKIGYSFTYNIQLTDFSWIKPFIKNKNPKERGIDQDDKLFHEMCERAKQK